MRDPATDGPIRDVLIVGASARAAAWSALRAGMRPVAVDQFGDADLVAIADSRVSADSPRDLARLAGTLTPGPWLYTGALENEPDVVSAISRERLLWGNSADTLTGVRDPGQLAACLEQVAPNVALPIRSRDDPPPRNGRWVVRPLRSAAGRGIRVWDDDCPDEPSPTEVFQRFAAGTPCSAVFVAGHARVELAGITRQLFSATRPFEWRGNLGPIDVPGETRRTLQRAGEQLRETFSLRGLFGVDFLVDLASGNPAPAVTEVNPRYTASVELLEHATGRSLLAEHARCFGEHASVEPHAPLAGTIVKWIAFASRTFEFRAFEDLPPPTDPWTLAPIADRPRRGTRFEPGGPFCTLFARGASPDGAFATLAEVTANTFVETASGRESLAELVEQVTFDG